MTANRVNVINWITEKAKVKGWKFRNLAHHLTPERLKIAYGLLNKHAVSGIDNQTAREFGKELNRNVEQLHQKLKTLRYRAPAVKRVWIPKGNGKKRPLGIPTMGDKVVQGAVKLLLEPIYEELFYSFSYGFRPNKSAHQALESLRNQCMAMHAIYVIDADIKDYFGQIRHECLKEFIRKKVVDAGIIRLIGKWLKAGVLEGGKCYRPETGTPQGGVISPLLANIYLHYVLDEWYIKTVKPRLRGKSFMVRYADDFLIVCDNSRDATRVKTALTRRLEKYGLELNEDKTRIVNFSRPRAGSKKGQGVIDYLGFRHYWAKSRKGYWVVKRHTQPQRLSKTKANIEKWCKTHRHKKIKEQHAILKRKLIGYYNYYGITFNSHKIHSIYQWTERVWYKWLNRRGGKQQSWNSFRETILYNYPLPNPRIVHTLQMHIV